jgi:hypothetical protein
MMREYACIVYGMEGRKIRMQGEKNVHVRILERIVGV